MIKRKLARNVDNFYNHKKLQLSDIHTYFLPKNRHEASLSTGQTHEEVVQTLRGTFSPVKDFWWVENKQGKHQAFLQNACEPSKSYSTYQMCPWHIENS